jgi:hypothetical protein
MRKLLLAAAAFLSLAVAAPAFSQGVQIPSAPNATPPIGTVPNASSSPPARVGPAHHRRRAHRRAVASERQSR